MHPLCMRHNALNEMWGFSLVNLVIKETATKEVHGHTLFLCLQVIFQEFRDKKTCRSCIMLAIMCMVGLSNS